MSMNPVGRKLSQDDQDLVAEYLKNGGKVTKGKDSTYSNELGISNNQWGQRRPKQKKQEDSEE
jgi:poly-D-alanine transfer protein DltD